MDVRDAANRDALFAVTSLEHFPYVANSDFHKPKHLYFVEDVGASENKMRDDVMSQVRGDHFDQAVRRAKAEFREMPGLKLTEAQAARLLSFDRALCREVLTALVEQHFLMRRRDTFQRPS